MRPTREQYFMEIAHLVAKRSTCTRAQVGAVLVYQNRVVSTGYNGSIPGTPHCIDEGCLMFGGHCIRTVHAEMNALFHLEHQYESLVLYCTHQPCSKCYQALISCNVSEIYYSLPYTDLKRETIISDLKYRAKIKPMTFEGRIPIMVKI